jgi:hypothetical protein
MTNTRRATTAQKGGAARPRHTEERSQSSPKPGHAQSVSESYICQESALTPGSSASEAIFLLNFDSPRREGYAFTLRGRRLKVFIPEETGRSLADLKDDELRQADYVLFDLTRLNHDDVFLGLRRLCRLRRSEGIPVQVTCLSKYRGAAFHLIVERLGARLVYGK